MKKILFILACVITVAFCAAPVPCSAQEAADVETETDGLIADETAESGEDTPKDADEKAGEPVFAQNTVFTRIWEYCITNKTEVLGLAGDAVIFLLAIFVKLRNDRKTKMVASDLAIVKGDAAVTASSQSSVVRAVNSMIDGYNEMRTSYELYGNTEADRNRLVGAVMVQNTAILDMLQTVYANSKNLPQGVKDVIMIKYANTLKALDSDEILSAVVDSVHEKVSAGAAISEISEDGA